jgi:hypothetical protein
MKKFLILIPLIALFACNKEIIRFEDPVADFSLPGDTVELLSSVKFTNNGAGEYFSFWPGDQDHDYSLKDAGLNNIGLPPNLGKDFYYSYTQSGSFTIVMVASSYDEESGKQVSVTTSRKIFVKPGNDGNFIEKFALNNVEKDYSPEATIYGDSDLVFRLARKYDIRVNTRPIRFRTENVKAVLTAQNGDTLYSDLSKLNLYDLTNNVPIINHINVYGYFNKLRVYKVITGFYPVVTSIKFTDGPNSKALTEVPGKPGVFTAAIFRDAMLPNTTTLTYVSEPGVVVTMDNDPTPLISGVTPITLTSTRHTFLFKKLIGGYEIITSVTLVITYI